MEGELNMAKEGKTGVTANTPKNIAFGSGTIHRGLKLVDGAWNYTESLVGATNGGSKVSIVPEIQKVEVDGANVAVKGLTVKTGETATMEVNFAELSDVIIKAATLGAPTTSEVESAVAIGSKANIEDSDYWENIAFIGRTLDGERIYVILPNALCTSGFELEGKNKEGSVLKCTFECHAEVESDLDMLPWKIEYPDRESA